MSLRCIPPVLAAALIGGMLLLGPAHAQPYTWTVDITDQGYRPQSITINLGDTITWLNIGTRVHSSTSDSCPGACVWDSGPIQPGESYSRTFTDAYAIYGYHSDYDARNFQGYVTVQVAPVTPTPTPGPSGTPSPTPTLPAESPTPTPTRTPGPTPTEGNLCYPPGEIAVFVPVLNLYVWVDGVWEESNGKFGLQREEFHCTGNITIPPDTKLV